MQIRKPKPIAHADFLPWTAAHFQSQGIRDRFLHVAEKLSVCDVEVEPMLDEICGALVRWRPGHFLGLNDVAHAHGGRIVLTTGRGHRRH